MPALDEVQPAPTVGLAPASRPFWQRWRVFRFIGSIQLAVVLLAVIIVAIIFGTIYESRFDADVARAYIYGATWFNLWMLFLVVNLAASAFSRWPWKRRHTGFLITHLGIIIILAGALIGRAYGVEGTMTLFKGRAPDNRLLVQQRQLYVTEGETARAPAATFPVRVVGRRPSAAKPWTLGRTPGGWKVELTDYAPHLTPRFQPEVPAATGIAGQPAARIRLVSPRLGRTMERWLLAGDAEHDAFDLGMAAVRLVPGSAPAAVGGSSPTAAGSTPATSTGDTVDETIVAFAKRPTDQAGQPATGKAASGVRVRLEVNGTRRLVHVEWRGAAWEFDADADRGKEEDLGNSGLFVRVGDFWPDFALKDDGQPTTASAEPNNPAVLVRVHGRLTAAAPAEGDGTTTAGSGLTAGDAPAPENSATLYCDAATGALTYSLRSGGSPLPVNGTLTLGQAISTGWADWQITVDQVLPRAIERTIFEPSETPPKGTGPMQSSGGSGPASDGVRVRLSRPGQPTHEQWVAAGWQVTTPTTGAPDDRPVQLIYGWQIEPLPIGLELTRFDVERNEGTDDPAGFKSTLRVTANDGTTDTGSCWMNNPHNFPGGPLHTWSGFTYKISQASWNPDNLDQSSVQILRDPGWSLKWIGCLLLCAGIFTLFYGRPHPGEAAARAHAAKP